MDESKKTIEEISAENAELRKRVLQLENEEARRRKAEQALKESEERFRDMAENIREAFWLFEWMENRVLYVSPAYEDIWGRRAKNLLERYDEWAESIHPDDLEFARESFARIAETGGGEPREYRIIRPDGEVRWILDRGFAIRDEKGQVCRIAGIAEDITERKAAEEALRESELFLKSVFDGIQDGISVLDSELNIIRVNRWMEKMYEHSKPLVGKKCYAAYHQRDSVCPWCPSVRTLETEEAQSEIVPYHTDKGPEGWIELSSFPLRDISGKTVGVIEHVKDITQRSLAQGELLREKEKLQKMIDGLPLGVSIITEDGGYKYLNPRFQKIFGYTLDDIPTGRDWFEKAYPDPEYRTAVIQAWKEDLDKSAREEAGPRIFTVACKDGAQKIIHFRQVPMAWGGHIIIYEDITHKELMARALKESEEKHRLVVDHANDAIFVVQDGILKFPNPKTLEITGYTEEELTEIPFSELIDPDFRDMVVKRHQKRLRGEKLPATYSFKIRNRRGEELWVEISAVLITWEGRPATLNFVRDITPQKRLEAQFQQAQKMEAIGVLAGGIAHDFNNLLQAVQGYAELLLLDTKETEPSRQDLIEIKRAAEKGRELTRQMLTFSRKVESRLSIMDVNREVRQVERLLGRTIPKMIEIELNLAEGSLTIEGDSSQIEQVLLNLAVNSRDAMPEGGRLSIATERITLDEVSSSSALGLEPGEYALVTVTDTGKGMEQETLEHIFDPFYSTKEVGKGTGLGLSMVYGIVKGHHGHIICESEPGRGTRFSIYLPLIEGEEESAGKTEEPPPAFGTETVLVVDDEQFVRDLGKKILTKFGYTVITATDGEAALEIFGERAGEIDLVILDLIMPGMGGWRCLEELIGMDPGAKVVVASGYSSEGHEKKALAAGAAGFISKPYEVNEILAVLKAVLGKEE